MLEGVLEVGAVPGTSVVHNLWAGTKLVCGLLLAAGLTMSGSLWGFGAGLALLIAAAFAARLSPALLWRGLRPLALAMAVGVVLLLCTTPGHAVAHIGPAVITGKGIENAIRLPGLLLVLALSAAIINRTTQPAQSVAAMGVLLSPLRYLRLPVDELLTMMAISLRFLPILAEEVTRLRQAQATRGLSLGEGTLESRGRAVEGWITSLISGNLRRADELGEAMEARGYGDPGARAFPVRRPHLAPADFAVFAGTIALVTAMFVVG